MKKLTYTFLIAIGVLAVASMAQAARAPRDTITVAPPPPVTKPVVSQP